MIAEEGSCHLQRWGEGQFLKCLFLYFDEYGTSSGKCVPGRQMCTSVAHRRREVET